MLVIHEDDARVDEPPPHGAIGMSTAYRISDAARPRAPWSSASACCTPAPPSACTH